jgi:hypothetical protein
MTPPCAVLSPRRAAGILPIITVAEPLTMLSGGPTQVAISLRRAAGIKPMSTVGQPGGRIGPPTWGFGPTGVGSCIGHVCISPTLAAGSILDSPSIRHYLSEQFSIYDKYINQTTFFPTLFNFVG